jgi:hypothetical protein
MSWVISTLGSSLPGHNGVFLSTDILGGEKKGGENNNAK